MGSIHQSHPIFFRSYSKQLIKLGYEITRLRREIARLRDENRDLDLRLAASIRKQKRWGVVQRGERVLGSDRFILRHIKLFIKELSKYTDENTNIPEVYVKYCLKNNAAVLNYVTTEMHLDWIKDMNRDMMYMYSDLDFLDSLVMTSVKYHWSRRSWNQFNEGVT